MENINLLRKLAWSFHKSTGLDWDDLFQEAALAYLEARDKYNSEKGKPSTYIWRVVVYRLNCYLSDERNATNGLCPIEEAMFQQAPSTTFLESLTKDAEEIANIVLSSSKKFVTLPTEMAEDRIAHLLERKGWDSHRIENGITELKMACS